MGHSKGSLSGKSKKTKRRKSQNINAPNAQSFMEHGNNGISSTESNGKTHRSHAKQPGNSTGAYAKANGIANCVQYSRMLNGNVKHMFAPDVSNTITDGTKHDNSSEEAHIMDENQHTTDGDGGVGSVTDARMFPRWTPWIVFAFTLVFRLWYVSDRANWWILHPDEVYQTLEVAHSEVYGYGFRAYEYLPPPENSSMMTTNFARAKEVEMGMYSLRSFLLAKCLAMVMFLVGQTGANISPFLVGKLFHACISSLLPVALFRFTQTLHGSRDVAAVSCILSASSTLLNVFGTHSLINSFLAPLVFFSLTSFIRVLNQKPDEPNKTSGNTYISHNETKHTCSTETELHAHIIDSNQNIVMGNGLHHNLNYYRNCVKPRNGYTKTYGNHNGTYINADPYHADKAFTNTARHSPTDMNGFATYNHSSHDELPVSTWTMCVDVQRHLHVAMNVVGCNYPATVSGFCLAVCVYMRADIVLLPLIMGLFSSRFSCRHIRYKLFDLRFFISGFVFGALIGGYEDFRSYGVWFISPLQWLKFNVLNNSAAVLFGENPLLFYLWEVVMCDVWHVMLFLLFVIDLSFCAVVARYKHGSHAFQRKGSNCVLYTMCVLAVLYSLNGHKEMRFFQNVLVLMYALYSRAIIRVYHTAVNCLNQNRTQYCIYYFYLCIALFTSSQFHAFLNVQASNAFQWDNNGIKGSSHATACLDFIRQQHDVTGVYMDQSIHTTGGYSVLNKNVPLLVVMKNEFYEFGLGFRHNIENKSLYTNKQSLTLFSSISDYIVADNKEYLSKVIVKAPTYNYLIIQSNQKFYERGYKEVFNYGDSKVLHRLTDTESETYLDHIGTKIPLATNATLLEFEAHALLQRGVYNRTELKLLFGNRLDGSRLGIYQLLMELYRKVTGVYSVERIIAACKHVHTANDCLGRYKPITLA